MSFDRLALRAAELASNQLESDFIGQHEERHQQVLLNTLDTRVTATRVGLLQLGVEIGIPGIVDGLQTAMRGQPGMEEATADLSVLSFSPAPEAMAGFKAGMDRQSMPPELYGLTVWNIGWDKKTALGGAAIFLFQHSDELPALPHIAAATRDVALGEGVTIDTLIGPKIWDERLRFAMDAYQGLEGIEELDDETRTRQIATGYLADTLVGVNKKFARSPLGEYRVISLIKAGRYGQAAEELGILRFDRNEMTSGVANHYFERGTRIGLDDKLDGGKYSRSIGEDRRYFGDLDPRELRDGSTAWNHQPGTFVISDPGQLAALNETFALPEPPPPAAAAPRRGIIARFRKQPDSPSLPRNEGGHIGRRSRPVTAIAHDPLSTAIAGQQASAHIEGQLQDIYIAQLDARDR